MEGHARWLTREERAERKARNMTDAEAADHIRRRLKAQLTEAERNARVQQQGTRTSRVSWEIAAMLQQQLDEFNAEFPPEETK